MSKPIKTYLYVNGKSAMLTGSITLTDNYHTPSNLSFQSPQGIKKLSTVHFLFNKNKKNTTVFGGQNVKKNNRLGENGYTVDSHERRLNGKITKVFTNQTATQIIKWVCKKKKVRLGKIKKTKKKYPKLAFESKKAIDICHQVATLEDNLYFWVNHDGLAELKKIPQQEKGYVFNHSNVSDYELSHDYSDIITGVKVHGDKNKELYNYNNKKMTATYGVINEIISDSNIKDKATAKAKGMAVFKEKKNPIFQGSITLPGILPNLKSGLWCSFKSTKKGKYHNYWIGSVVTTVSNNEMSQKLTLYDGKPAPPSDWIYVPPNENKSEDANCNEKTVSNPVTVYGTCGACGYTPTVDKGGSVFLDECVHPSCKNKKKGLSFTPKKTGVGGEWTCKACGADYCAKCGKEKIKSSSYKLKKSQKCKAVKGVPQEVATKANSLGSVSAVHSFCKSLKYEFYYDSKQSISTTLSRKAGNCYDTNALMAAMLKQLGYSDAVCKCGFICVSNGKRYGHCVCVVTINGQKWAYDGTCGGKKWRV